LSRVRQVLDRDIGDAEERAGGRAEEQASRGKRDAAVGRGHGDRGADDKDAALDRNQRGLAQEVAGSSPASSISRKPRSGQAFVVGGTLGISAPW
jgi:hypothetical protein